LFTGGLEYLTETTEKSRDPGGSQKESGIGKPRQGKKKETPPNGGRDGQKSGLKPCSTDPVK